MESKQETGSASRQAKLADFPEANQDPQDNESGYVRSQSN
jgi:hypothetical protein